jgi:hypothetical protein
LPLGETEVVMRISSALLSFALAAAMVPFASASAHADDKDERIVRLDQIPVAAAETIKHEAAGSPVLDVAEETVRGQIFYEAHVKKADGATIGVRVDPSGNLIDRHTEKTEKENR